MNTALYGAASMLMGQRQVLRGPLLYAVAVFSVLFTFGHHHYASPQPELFKSLAVLASLLAIVSFLRHLRASKAGGDKITVKNKPAWTYPMSAVQLWTLVATGSGILLAIPYINTVLHGTYAVVVHAMGSMIGVNFLIVVAGGLALIKAPTSRWRVRRGVQLISSALIGLWCYLGALGIHEGISRTNTDLLVLSQQVRPLLYGFVLIGGVLSVGIAMLCWELIAAGRSAVRDRAKLHRLFGGEVVAQVTASNPGDDARGGTDDRQPDRNSLGEAAAEQSLAGRTCTDDVVKKSAVRPVERKRADAIKSA